jgi:Fe-S-cluster containining protein
MKYYELEKDFICKKCGNCCFIFDAFSTTADPEDIQRWKDEKRYDILEHLRQPGDGKYYLWLNSGTGKEAVHRCPWYIKNWKTGIASCKIHNSKPTHCRKYPLTTKTMENAINHGCLGWNDYDEFRNLINETMKFIEEEKYDKIDVSFLKLLKTIKKYNIAGLKKNILNRNQRRYFKDLSALLEMSKD